MGWICTVLFVLSTAVANAQQIEALVDKNKVNTAETFRYTIRMSGNQRGDIEPPAFTDFDVVSGPAQSQQTQIINGNYSQWTELTYVLRAKREGTLTIGKAKFVSGNVTTGSNALTIEAVATTETLSGNVLGRINVDRTEAYVGEQIIATYNVLNRENNPGFSNFELPENTGFNSVKLQTEEMMWLSESITVNGLRYQQGLIRKDVLFPNTAGTLELDQFRFVATIGSGFFTMGEQKVITSNKQTIKVKPLPAGAPESFTGAVGDFAYALAVDKNTIKVNEPLTLEVSVSGRGNLKFFDVPIPDFNAGNFEVFEPEINTLDTMYGNDAGGYRTYTYIIMPRIAGEYSLAPVKFSYFDLTSERYKEIVIPGLNIDVRNADGSAAGPAVLVEDASIQADGQDEKEIRTLQKGPLQKIKRRDPQFLTPEYLLGLLAPFFLFIMFFLGRRIYLKTRKSEEEIRVIKAKHKSLDYLEEARIITGEGGGTLFYEKIQKAIYSYLSDKLDMGYATLNQPLIKQRLASEKVSESTINQLNQLIDECMMARYAPVAEVPRAEILDRTESVIQQLEKELA